MAPPLRLFRATSASFTALWSFRSLDFRLLFLTCNEPTLFARIAAQAVPPNATASAIIEMISAGEGARTLPRKRRTMDSSSLAT